jgi:hypothetical protein
MHGPGWLELWVPKLGAELLLFGILGPFGSFWIFWFYGVFQEAPHFKNSFGHPCKNFVSNLLYVPWLP